MPPKNRKNRKNAIHFSVDEGDPFVVTDHSFKVVIRGRPIVWKRVSWRYGCHYTPSKRLQDEFCTTVRSLFLKKGIPILDFGDAELEMSVQFCLPPPVKSGKITNPPDVDNLLKFIFDSLQGTFYSNDSAITKVRDLEKKFDCSFGGDGYTVLYLARRVIDVDNTM
jgi:Holliday junction resolvase RusA-like endonuclease